MTLSSEQLEQVRGGLTVKGSILQAAIDGFRRERLFPADIANASDRIARVMREYPKTVINLDKARPLLGNLSLREISNPFRGL